MTKFLNGLDDMQWLFEVHLKHVAGYQREARSFEIVGNEDCPDCIKLYASKEPLLQDEPFATLKLQGDMSYREI